MRLTVNLDADVYRAAKAVALAEEATVSGAVNLLLRKALGREDNLKPKKVGKSEVTRFGFPKVACERLITSEDVARMLDED